MNSFKNKKAYDLYVNKPLLKALLIIIIPSLLMTLMTGIYYFANQIIIVKLLPIAHGNAQQNFNYWFGNNINYLQIKDLCKQNGLDFYDVSDIVKSAISISSPIATIIGTSPFFIAGGATVLFTQSLGNNNQNKASEVYKTSFWMVTFLSLLEMIVLISINHPLLNALSSPIKHVENNADLNSYFIKAHDLQIKIASQLTIVYASCLIIPMFMVYFGSLIKSEGRFKIVVAINIICNIANIGITSLFVLVIKTDGYSAPISTLLCQSVNLAFLLIYLSHLNKHYKTWLQFKLLFKKGLTKFKLNLVSPIVLVGLSAFLIDISFSIANMFFIPILAHTASNESMFPQANGDGMYFQTIEGAVMPILNLVFIAIYGIIEGGRLIIAYNYALGNWKRIKKTFYWLIIISLVISFIMLAILTLALGHLILQYLFNIPNHMLHNAYLVLILENAMVIIFCFQVSAMALFMAIGDILRSNISAIFQDVITFFPVLGICVGLTYLTNDIWILVACYVINAFVATAIMTAYSIWWINKRLGKIMFKLNINNKVKKIWMSINRPRPSFVQLALQEK